MNQELYPAPMPEAMLDKLGPIVRETVIVEGREFLIDQPGAADKLINHPAVHEAFRKDEYMPYWAELWPASRMLAKAILHEPWTPGTEALEVGNRPDGDRPSRSQQARRVQPDRVRLSLKY